MIMTNKVEQNQYNILQLRIVYMALYHTLHINDDTSSKLLRHGCDIKDTSPAFAVVKPSC